MGHLSRMRSQGKVRGGSGGHGKGPLRLIVRSVQIGYGVFEVLECGHRQLPVRDLIGETNAKRRRCSKCKRGAPPDADIPPER
jgi:hypothetical protein